VGMVYAAGLDFTPADLARIDAYEDFDPDDPAASLYLRRAVTLSDGSSAQAYAWNGPLPPGARAINHGDFRHWLAEEGARGFGA
jgi:Gamma-glutamyl cyclotransferase, AIG2-like